VFSRTGAKVSSCRMLGISTACESVSELNERTGCNRLQRLFSSFTLRILPWDVSQVPWCVLPEERPLVKSIYDNNIGLD
jgi:hypothetical protein